MPVLDPPLTPVMLVAGAAWIVFLSLFNVLVLNNTPDWVRARVLAVSTLVFQGAVAAGSAAWGAVAVRLGVGRALLCAGARTLAMTALALFLKLPDETVDLTSWNHWRRPAVDNDTVFMDDNFGPVLVTGRIPGASTRSPRIPQSNPGISTNSTTGRRAKVGHLSRHGEPRSLCRNLYCFLMAGAPAAARPPDQGGSRNGRTGAAAHYLAAKSAALDLRGSSLAYRTTIRRGR